MLTLPPERISYEAARAREIEAAQQALDRSRLRWFALGLGLIFVGTLLVGFGFHTSSANTAQIMILSGLLIGEIGPLGVLIAAVQAEEM